jgi:glucose/mannose-6-phosphate isomerase
MPAEFNMLNAIRNFPKQCEEALGLENSLEFRDIDSIVIAAMGNTATAGHLLKSYLADSKIPVEICSDYNLPGFVNEATLVFAISHSGNSEETLNAYQEAVEKGAKTVGMTSGGQLEKMCKDNLLKLPAGLQQRAALAYLFFPMLKVLENSGIVDPDPKGEEEMLNILRDRERFDMGGKVIAKKIGDRTPIIYSSQKLYSLALRWKYQFNENSKVPSFANFFPNLNHFEIEGYKNMDKEHFVVILLRDRFDHPKIQKRMDLTKELIDVIVDVMEVETLGNSLLSRMFSSISLGDYASYHLAMLKNSDPNKVEINEYVKEKMREI